MSATKGNTYGDSDSTYVAPYPHCDARVLHAPGECAVCDHYPEKQQERRDIGIAFTGHQPEKGEAPCPADAARGDGHKQWSGNVAVKKGERHQHLGAWFIVE